jgi:isoquinoline 1-oxidoreductase alpha subunit
LKSDEDDMIRFTLNGEDYNFSGDGDTPLLWVLRDSAGLTGTKYGCGAGLCGACTVHVDGEARRACVLPSSNGSHPVQQAWREANVPQCGYCQTGQIMAVAAMLERLPAPSDDDIDRQHTNICRCGAYSRIRKAIHRASELSGGGSADD